MPYKCAKFLIFEILKGRQVGNVLTREPQTRGLSINAIHHSLNLNFTCMQLPKHLGIHKCTNCIQ